MAVSVDYYNILEVSQSASTEEIRRSYRSLVRKYHPDSGEVSDSAKFQLIQQAWEILGDMESRRDYDKKREKFEWGPVREKKLEEYKRKRTSSLHGFGSVKPLTDPKNDSKVGRKRKGSSSSFKYPHKTGEDGSESDVRTEKFGRSDSLREKLAGVAASAEQSTSFLDRVRDAAGAFGGSVLDASGKKASGASKRVFQLQIDTLESLRGATREVVLQTPGGERRVKVEIPVGITSGCSFKVDCPLTKKFPEQEITVKVEVKEHPFVQLNGLDVLLTLPVKIGEAIAGTEIQIPTLKGLAKVSVPPGWKPGKKLRIKGAGMESGTSVGDLFIKPQIYLPDAKASPQVIEQIAKAIDDLYINNIRAGFPKKLT